MPTKKDFISIAKILSDELQDIRSNRKHFSDETRIAQEQEVERIIDALCLLYSTQNPAFDRDRFEKACYGAK